MITAIFTKYSTAISQISFLRGDINKDMFIDNPMSHSTKYLSEINNYSSNDKKTEGRWELYEEKEKIRLEIKNEIDQLSIAKIPLILTVSGQSGHPLRVQIKTPDTLFEVLSESNLCR
jgi:putative protease